MPPEPARRPRAPSLAEQAQTRELAALLDGPWAPAWLWRDTVVAQAASSARMGYPDHHPAAAFRHYQPTDEHVAHPVEPGVTARVWSYQPPSHRGRQRPAQRALSGP